MIAGMTAENIGALIVAVLLDGVPRVRTAVPGQDLMSVPNWIQFIAFVAVVVATAIPIGRYMAKVYGDGEKAPGDRLFAPIERVIYRICRIDPASRAALDRVRVLAARLQRASRSSPSTGCSAFQGDPAAQSGRSARLWCRTCRSTPP